MDWYYVRDGEQFGPFPDEDFLEMVDAETITKEDLVWNETMDEWAGLEEALEQHAAVEEAMRNAPPKPRPTELDPEEEAAISKVRSRLAESPGDDLNHLAIGSIGLSAVGFVCCGFLGVAGAVCGHLALAQMKADPLAFSPRSRPLAIAGTILGYLSLLMLAVQFYFINRLF